MSDALQEATKRHHFEAVMVLQEIEDELKVLIETRDKMRRLADSLERLSPELTVPRSEVAMNAEDPG